MSDPDPVARKGIAVTGLTVVAGGRWQFNTGSGWTDFSVVSLSSALLLRDSDQIRFLAATSVASPTIGTATITYRGWDQSTGPEIQGTWANLSTGDKVGGTTAYSAQKQVGTIFVGAVGELPSLISMRRLDPVQASGGSVRFNATFSADVTNVTPNDFRLSTTGTARGAIASVSGQGSSYVIVVNSLAGNGTLGLALDDAHDIRSGIGASVRLTSPPVNETYNLSAIVILAITQASISEAGGISNVTATLPAVQTTPVPDATKSSRIDASFRGPNSEAGSSPYSSSSSVQRFLNRLRWLSDFSYFVLMCSRNSAVTHRTLTGESFWWTA